MQDYEPRLRASGLPTLVFTPHIEKLDESYAHGFGDLPMCEGFLEHRFNLLMRPDFEIEGQASTRPSGDIEPPLPWERLESLVIGEEARRLFGREGEFPGKGLLLATLNVTEYVARCAMANGGWAEWVDLEALGWDMQQFMKWSQSDDNPELNVFDGSLFHLRTLQVHPAVRGQRIGLRLIAHAVATLWRCSSDLVVGLVNPIRSDFEPEQERSVADKESDPVGRDKLLQYYRELGFQVWRPRRRLKPSGPAVIYHSLSMLPYLNVELEEWARC